MIVGHSQDGTYERRSEKISMFIKPIAKVLKLGNDVSDNYKSLRVGSIITIPDNVRNTIPNPEFVNLLQMQRGNQEPILPKGMRKEIAIFDQVWDSWRFQFDKLGDITTEDTVTFLIHLNTQTVQSIVNL